MTIIFNTILAISQHLTTFLTKDQFCSYIILLGFTEQEWEEAAKQAGTQARNKNSLRITDIYNSLANNTTVIEYGISWKALKQLGPLDQESVKLTINCRNLASASMKKIGSLKP